MQPKQHLKLLFFLMSFVPFLTVGQNALHFDGVNDYIQTTASGISGTNARTIEAWIKVPNTTNTLNGKIVSWGVNSASQKSTFRIQGTNGTNGAIRYEVNGGYVVGNTDLRDGLWHHVAVTWSNDGTPNVTDAKLYVDGVLETKSSQLAWAVNTSTLNDIKIGKGFNTATFEGVIDEVRVWNYAKTVSQIIADTGNIICPPHTGLVAYHNLDHGTAAGGNANDTISADSSGLNNNGTLMNFALTGSTSNWVAGKSLTACYPVCYGPTTVLTECEGYSITVNGNTYSSTGVYTDTLVGVGCDSIVVTDLTINPIPVDSLVWVECSGFSITVNGNTYNTSGIYYDTIVAGSSLGCDSIVITDLTVGNYKTTNQSFTECDGFSVSVGTNTYTTTGMYSDTLIGLATGGCDSVVHTDLTILNHSTATDVIVACDSYTWNGVTYTSSNNTALDTLVNAVGCDSIITLDLTINYSTSSTDVQSACDGYVWMNGVTYTSSNSTATHVMTNSAGCDSVITLNLTITNSTSYTDVQSACGSYTWINGVTYTSSTTTAKDTLVNAVGCDSIVTLNLTINPAYSTVDVQTVCDSLTWVDGVTYYSNNNTATFTTQSIYGCDSVATLDLTIINSSVFIDVVQACDDYTWIDGNTYTSSNNTATHTLVSSNGCDSLVLLNLTVGEPNTGEAIITHCGSYTWIDGVTYTANNINSYFTLTNASGCDSVVRLFLTIVPLDVTTTNTWATITATETGVQYQWIDCSNDAPIAGETNRKFVATQNGSYKVEIKNGTCTDTSDCVNLTSVGIEENELGVQISLFPNPTDGKVQMTMETGAGEVQINVLDISGKSHLELITNQGANRT